MSLAKAQNYSSTQSTLSLLCSPSSPLLSLLCCSTVGSPSSPLLSLLCSHSSVAPRWISLVSSALPHLLCSPSFRPRSSHVGHGLLGNQPPPLPHHHHSSVAMFDPLSNYFDHPLSSRSPQLPANPNSLLNLDAVWSKNLRSETNCTDLGGFMSSTSPTQQFLANQQQAGSRAGFPCLQQIPQGPDNSGNNNKSSVSGASDQQQPNNNNRGDDSGIVA